MRRLRAGVATASVAALNALRRLWYRGRSRACPVCGGHFRRFLSAGVVEPRSDALCPGCSSLERHRFAALLLAGEARPAHGGRTLHIAPERAMARLLARRGNFHVSGDLYASDVDVRFDLAHLPFADGSFGLVYCSHVLEHVDDDRAAMRELRRVLARDGVALVQVPIDDARERTFEDPTVRSPAERARLFGQEDHARVYGVDAVHRLRDAGFEVRAVRPGEFLSPDEVLRMGLDATERAFVCRVPVAA